MGFGVQEVYWRVMPVKNNRREKVGLGKSDADCDIDLTKSCQLKWGPTERTLLIREIPVQAERSRI
jgi:hypothetical protein